MEKVTMRSVVLGAAMVVVLCWFTPENNIRLENTPLGGGYFPLAPFVLLLFLAVIYNPLFGRLLPRLQLNSAELLIIWIMTTLASGIPYRGLLRNFYLNITTPFYYATGSNMWAEKIQPFVPTSLVPRDPQTIQGLYRGLEMDPSTGLLLRLQAIPWSQWLVPLAVWSLFVLLCYGMFLCMVALLSQQWVVNENLNFPLLQIPMDVADSSREGKLLGFLTNRFLLAGVAIPVFLHLINGLYVYFPVIPQIPTLVLMKPYFPRTGLLEGFSTLRVYFFPAFIGFAFLTPRQLSLSFWFFYLLGKLLQGLLPLVGLEAPPAVMGPTFDPELERPEAFQTIGALIVTFGFLLYLARDHLRRVGASILGRNNVESQVVSLISPRLSALGLLICFSGLVAWCLKFGMSVWIAVMLLALFFVIHLVVARVICQGGLALFTLTVAPLDGILGFLGSKIFAAREFVLTVMIQKILFMDFREALMPSMMHAAKLAERIRGRRILLLGATLSIALGLVVSYASVLTLFYTHGINQLRDQEAVQSTLLVYDTMDRVVSDPQPPRKWPFVFGLSGACAALVNILFYHRFYWWPLHPLGYLTMYSWAMKRLWFSYLLGWFFNTLTLRYGGAMFFRKVRFFFIGLIIGDFLMGGIWGLISMWTRVQYMVLPG